MVTAQDEPALTTIDGHPPRPRPALLDWHEDLQEEQREWDPDPEPDEPGWFGPDLDYAYDPGAGGEHMAGWA